MALQIGIANINKTLRCSRSLLINLRYSHVDDPLVAAQGAPSL